MTKTVCLLAVIGWSLVVSRAVSGETGGRTTLTDPSIKYRVPDKPYVILRRGPVEIIVVDNSPVDDAVLPGHRGGYSGVASLKHEKREQNLFVPSYAGLNFEHIHDGTERKREILFEPRHAPMKLRSIDSNTVELYQPPTPTYQLESSTRYRLLPDGTIEMSFECIPRAKTFSNGYVGLFWASYIHQPESLDIHFIGHDEQDPTTRWIRGVTPSHGVDATHLAMDDRREFAHEPGFHKSIRLVFGLSKYRYDEPWYYGVSHGMAMVMMFRERDRIRMSQSPTGGGQGNPAWDFQFLVPKYEVGQCYGYVLRAMYVPFESPERIVKISAPHRQALNPAQ